MVFYEIPLANDHGEQQHSRITTTINIIHTNPGTSFGSSSHTKDAAREC